MWDFLLHAEMQSATSKARRDCCCCLKKQLLTNKIKVIEKKQKQKVDNRNTIIFSDFNALGHSHYIG